jgi:hypothetical protein
MTDQELLTYAAKAIGFSYDDEVQCIYSWNMDYVYFWTSLENDADAFNLMVKLNIEPSFSDCEVRADFYNVKGIDGRYVIEHFKGEDEKLKALKRVLTRAAAEIGKAMK